MERTIATLLRTGVILSAFVVLLGGVCFLYRHGSEPASYQAFRGADTIYRSVPGILGAVGSGNCRAVIQLGLLILIGTPIARVGFSMVAFAVEHDRTYIVISAIVLAVLLYSILYQ